jgi:minor extracellular serine protease Vpr
MVTHRVRARFAALTIALLLATTSISANAGDIDAEIANPVDNETASLWFVELSTTPTSEGTSATTVAASKTAFRNAANSKRISYTERFAYGDLWNGFSVAASATDVRSIQRLPGVARVWPVATERLPASAADGGETIDLATAVQMTGADYVQNTLGFTGKNIKVAVMDTGIDYDNPDLGGCFGDSCRVFTGWDFVGDDFNADPASLEYDPTAVPDADPDDCNGHGTHVAGIVGARGAVTGVAPDVRFGAYRVFGCEGSTTADIMLAAMERALADHMDVLNMSIGSAFQWPQYPTAVAADRLVRKHGIVVVASIGNSGTSGLYAAGAPGLGEHVIGVASFDNSHVLLPYFTATPDGRKFGYNQATGAPSIPVTGSLPLTRTGTSASAADACTALPAGSLAGKVALIRRGTCTFNVKAINAQNAGAAAVLIYNNAPGIQSITVAGPPNVLIPVASISKEDGDLLDSRLASGVVSITWTSDQDKFPSATGGLVSSFSSYGLSPDLSLKPDIGAPGGNIYSTLPLEQGGHGVLSGTSMSSPHVAGAVALLLQAIPKNLRELNPGGVRGLLQNSAEPHLWFGNPTLGLLDNVQRQGAGMLDIRATIEAGASIAPSKLALGESQSGPATRTLTISDRKGPNGATDDNGITYTFSHQPALALGNTTFAPSFFVSSATVVFSAPSVSVKRNKSASVNVTITAPAGLQDRGTYGGYIVISGDDGSVNRVPYSGFKGDYQSIPVLTGRKDEGRQLGFFSNAGAIASATTLAGTYGFTMKEQPNVTSAACPTCGFGPATFLDVPYYRVHLDHQARSAHFTVWNASGTTLLGDAFPTEEFLPRNSTATGFFTFAWDGTATTGGVTTTLANGDYVVKMTLTKALGGPADVETHTFVKVNIARVP